MKPSRIVWMFWLGNLMLLAAASAFMWIESASSNERRNLHNAAIAEIKPREPRIQWQDGKQAAPFQMVDTRLSPIERPKPPAPPIVQPPPPVEVEKTDDQLRDELEAALNKRFRLLRMMLSSTDDYPDIALVVADSARMQWFEGMNLKTEYENAKSAGLRKLAWDATVLRIDAQGVLVDAASLEKPDKRFEILLAVSEDPLSATMFNAPYLPDRKALIPIEPTDKPGKQIRPKDEPGHEEEFSKGDFSPEAIDDFAKYTRATEHGIEILPELPEDSPARKYGAQGGEIIKTINGEAVKSMSDVRRIVRTQYDAGTREFKVGFERDGVPGEKVITAPEKKTNK